MIRNLLFIIGILISLHTMAATHTVTSNKGQGPGSLSGMIADAQPGDIIVFSEHVFYPGGFYNTIILNSEVTIDKDLTIEGPVDQDGHAFVLIKVPVTAQEAADHSLTASDYRLFNISGKYKVNISNIRFKGGDISRKNQWGGIINARDADLDIRNSSFCDTKATYGGAIFTEGGSLFLVKDSLSNNNSIMGGGAIRGFKSVLNIDYCCFLGNTETAGHGGAINTNNGFLTVTNSVFRNNTGFFSGGAIAGFGPTYLYHNSFVDNIVTDNHSYGGAVRLQDDTGIVNCMFTGNSAVRDGGAIYGSLSRLHIAGTTCRDNKISNGKGGAIHAVVGNQRADLYNCIITGNYRGNTEDNICLANGNMAYSVYGTGNDLDNITDNIHNTQAPASSVFTGNGIEISPAGEAVKAGTLVGQLGDDFYYRDMDDNQWKSFTTGNTLAFDIGNTVDYGLGQGSDIYITSLNGMSRVLTHDYYNAGAYVLDNRSNLTIDAIPGQVYTGSEILPEVKVRSGNTVLVKGTDYDLVYSNHINVGTATVTVTCKGSYSGIFRVTFGITARQITTVDAIPDQIHTGAAITPEPVVKSDGVLLAAGVDYEVSYLNNTDTGTATVVITGKGNYSGTLHAMFNIVKALNVDILEIITDGAVYDPAAGLYVADCGRTDVVITVVPVDHTVRIIYNGIEGNPFTVTVEKAGFYTVNFTVVSRDYSLSKDYSLVVEKRFEFNEVVVTRWNNTMTVINNPLNNGGYTFTGWKWFRNGSEMTAGQSVSAGNDGYPLNTSDRYYVELTVNGYDRPLRTCEGTPGIRNTGLRVWPNPGSRSGTVSIETDPELMPDAVIEIYNVLGVCTCRTQVTGRITLVSLPSVQGLYIIRLKGKDFEENIKMVVN